MKHKVAIITAASRGMGAACARELAEKNYHVVLMSTTDSVLALADELGGNAFKITELKNVDWVGAQVPLSLISKLAASKYNRKYADLAEGEKKIVRTVIKGNPEEKKELHTTLIKENITLVNNRLSETSDIDIKEKLLEVKEKLLNFNFSKDEYVDNIIKLNTLRLDLIQK